MLVQIDSREKDRVKSAKEYFKSQGLEVEITELEIGDYIFTDGNDSVVFEFKRIPDFITSIQNNKVFNQAINQAENYNHHFVIIQGNEHERTKCLAMTKHYRPVSIFQYHGALASLNRYTTVIESYSPYINEAYYKMIIQARKCLSTKPIVKKFPKKDKNPAFNFLCHDVHGINSKKAKIICDTLNLHNKKDLDRITKKDLTSIEGIGPKTAELILNAIGE